jgi:hypothetical protein
MKKAFGRCALVSVFTLSAAFAGASGEVASKRAEHDSPAQTDPNSPFWREAPATFATVDTFGKAVPGHRTEIRSRWTRDNLYFLFICPYDKLFLKPQPKTKTETNELWNWDVAEVFIGSDFKNIRRYKEFEVSPQSEWIDLDVDLTKPHHEDGWVWNSGFQVSARIDTAAKVWYAAMRIPYAAVDSRTPAAGNLFRVNFYRAQGPNHQAIAWRPTGKETYHVPESFGTLKLVD